MRTIESIGWHFRRSLGLCAALLAALPVFADYTLRVNPREDRGEWDGWGCSLSWWGHGIGKSAYENLHADLFFTTGTVAYAGKELPGLGMTILRYNIGGGGRNDAGKTIQEAVSPKVPWFKDIDGYWINRDNPDPASASWDWSRDANQRSMLQAACRRGVTWVEFFANAPMWWMMDSRSSAGGQLLAEHERDFAHYLATVAWKAKTDWGINVRSIEPFNEPQAGWWKYPMQQEGCNIPKKQQKSVLGHLKNELHALALDGVQITASDENAMTEATAGYNFFKTQTVAVGNANRTVSDLIDKINVHSYCGLQPWRDNNARTALRQAAGNKRLWASEFCDDDATGMALAQTITEDLNWLRSSAWIYWQPVEPYSPWGFLNADYKHSPEKTERGKPLRVYTKYYVFAQFTRFLRPGYHLIGSNDLNSIAAHDAAGKRLILITVNYTPQRIDYDLGGLAAVGATATVTRTQADGSACFATGTIPIKDGKFSINATEKTIYSIVVEGVRL